ncbi:MAG: efflux RND transporter permease subunit [bacterium]
MNLVSFSVKRPVATTVFYLAVLVIGVFSLAKIGVDLFPPVEFPFVSITTVYRGASPADIETLISKKIEDAVSEIDGIRHISSMSMEDMSQVFIEFEMSKKLDVVAQDVREKIDLIQNELPDDADAPIIQKLDLKAKPIMNLVLTGDRNMVELYTLADEVITEKLSRAEGVASVDILGGQKREILIAVDQDKLSARNLSLEGLIQALNAANLDVPGGHITQAGREYTLRLEGEFDTVPQMRQLFLTSPHGETIPITDVCTISDSSAEQRMMTIINGREGIGLSVKKRGDANVVAVVNALRKKIAEVQETLPSGISLDIINDDSAFITASIDDVRDSIIIGIILTTLVLFVFLHNVWLTIIAALTMPISIIATFILLRFAGFTFNMMSLMALGLAVGVLVDNAIVVLENIFNYRQKKMSAAEAAELGTGEIALAVAASTMTNLVVFLPIAFMSGIIGQFFRQFGMTTIFVTVVSLVISFTLTPMLYAVLARKEEEEGKKSLFTPFYQLWDRGYEAMVRAYGNLVDKSLRRRWLVIAISLALFFAATRLVPFIGSEFITQADKAELSVTLELPPGTPLEKTRSVMDRIDRVIRKDPEVQKRFITLGILTGGLGNNIQGPHVGQMLIRLSDKTARDRTSFQIQDELRAQLQDIPDATITIGVPDIGGGSEAPLQIEISGDDFARLEELSTKMVALARKVQGTTDVGTSWKPGKPQLSIYPDRIRIKDLGLSVAQIASVIRTSVEGRIASKFRVEDKEYDMRVKLVSQQRQDISQVKDFQVFLPKGGNILLSQVTRIEKTSGPASIIRKDKHRVIIVSANLTGGATLGNIIEEIKNKSADLFHGGYRLFFAGQAEHMAESFGEIFSALFLAVILTYLVMAALLESFLQPFSIMFTFPLAMIGVWGALLLTGMTFSIFSLMAIVMLVGYVVNVAILILDYTTILRSRGMDRNAALTEACRVRLRPIFMTTLTTIFGMLPLALGIGWGAETRAPMAVVFIGGLIASTLMTLFVIPVVYTYMEDVAAWPGKMIRRFKGGEGSGQ